MSVSGYPWLKRYPSDVKWDSKFKASPATDLLDASVKDFPDRPALNFMGKKTSYAALGQKVRAVAAGLQALGVSQGMRVGLFLPNTPYYVIFYYAILKIGGVVVNFNPLYPLHEIKHKIEDSGTAFMVTLDMKMMVEKLEPLVGSAQFKKLIICPMAAALPWPTSLLYKIFKGYDSIHHWHADKFVTYESLLEHGDTPKPVTIDSMRDVAVLQYTGGTTGSPKGAMLSHANIYINTQQCAAWFPSARLGQEKVLGVIPFFHVFAMTAVMNLGIRLGAEITLLPRFELRQVIKTIHKTRPTFFPAVPTIYTAINNFKDIKKYNLSSIKYCISGGAGLPVEVKQAFEEHTGCILVEGYGLTESSPVTNVNPLQGLQKTGSIGLPLPQTIVEIISLDDKNTILPVGEKGEVCIRGPQVMLGYWGKPVETAAVLVAGRLHTGDVGIMDEDGYVRIVDRIKDMILCSGFNVYPRNVEEQIYLHPAVEEVVAGGVADAYRGQSVKVWVKLKAGQQLTADELHEFLKDRLSAIEIPKHVEFRDALPKTLIGKLDRKALLAAETTKETAPE